MKKINEIEKELKYEFDVYIVNDINNILKNDIPCPTPSLPNF